MNESFGDLSRGITNLEESVRLLSPQFTERRVSSRPPLCRSPVERPSIRRHPSAPRARVFRMSEPSTHTRLMMGLKFTTVHGTEGSVVRARDHTSHTDSPCICLLN